MVLVDVLEEHLDEATFLWERWEAALVAPDFTLHDTAMVEERLAAHLHGLVMGGDDAAGPLLFPALDCQEATRISAAAHALLAQGHAEGVLNVLRGGAPEARDAIRRAVELSGTHDLGAHLLPLLSLDEPSLQAQTMEALAFRNEASSEVLAKHFLHDEPRARTAALRACPPLPENSVRHLLPRFLESEHPGVRSAAMEAGLTSGARIAWEACRQAARARNVHTPGALVLVALFGSDADTALLVDALGHPESRPHALWALGFSGRVTAMEACLEYMDDPRMARLAGEAFSAMTGLRMEGRHVLPPGEQPEGAPSRPELREDLDADLVPRPEDELPWPRAEALRSWWRESLHRFVAGGRYLAGQLLTGQALLAGLEQAPMRRRHVLALELAVRSQGRHRIPTRAFSHRQRTALSQAHEDREPLRLLPLERTLR